MTRHLGFFTLTTIPILSASTAFAQGQIPNQIPIQGTLADSDGVGLNRNVTITFTIYDAPSAGQVRHQETQAIDVGHGAFTAYLGAAANLDLSLFAPNSDTYIGIQVEDDAEMEPRIRLATVPFAALAQRALDAVTINGQAATDFAPVTHEHAWSEISDTPQVPEQTVVEDWARGVCINTAAEVVETLGTKFDNNPLNHNRYTNEESVVAMGNIVNSNTLNHDRYIDSEAVAAMGTTDNANDLNHNRYIDSEAIDALDTSGRAPMGRNYSMVLRAASRGNSSSLGAKGVWIDGVKIFTPTRSYGLVVIARSTGNVVFQQSYDVYGNAANADNLAKKLSGYSNNHIIVITTFDEPRDNRTRFGLGTQIKRCGGSEKFVRDVKFRGAYLLVGICNMGEGTGHEMIGGAVDSANPAFVETTLPIFDGGLPFGSSEKRRRAAAYRTGDPRPGCPGPYTPWANMIAQTITVRERSAVSVNAEIIRRRAGRADLYLYRNSDWVARAITNSAIDDWKTGGVSWTGTLNPGTYTFSIRSGTATIGGNYLWGCQADWGRINTIVH